MPAHEPLPCARSVDANLVVTHAIEIGGDRYVPDSAKADPTGLTRHEPLARARSEHRQHVAPRAVVVEQRDGDVPCPAEADAARLPGHEPRPCARPEHRQNVLAGAVVVPQRDGDIARPTEGGEDARMPGDEPLARARPVDCQLVVADVIEVAHGRDVAGGAEVVLDEPTRRLLHEPLARAWPVEDQVGLAVAIEVTLERDIEGARAEGVRAAGRGDASGDVRVEHGSG